MASPGLSLLRGFARRLAVLARGDDPPEPPDGEPWRARRGSGPGPRPPSFSRSRVLLERFPVRLGPRAYGGSLGRHLRILRVGIVHGVQRDRASRWGAQQGRDQAARGLTASRTIGRRPNFSRSGVGAAGHDVPGPRLSCSPPVMIQEGRTAQCRTRLQDHGSTVGGHGVPRSKPGLRFALRSARQSVRRMGGWIAAIMDVPPVERPVAHDHQGWGEGRAGAGWVAGRLLPLLGG